MCNNDGTNMIFFFESQIFGLHQILTFLSYPHHLYYTYAVVSPHCYLLPPLSELFSFSIPGTPGTEESEVVVPRNWANGVQESLIWGKRCIIHDYLLVYALRHTQFNLLHCKPPTLWPCVNTEWMQTHPHVFTSHAFPPLLQVQHNASIITYCTILIDLS